MTIADFPTGGSARDKLAFAVKHATLACPVPRWKPWEFRLNEQSAELYAANGPVVEAADPEGRKTMISSGITLQYLKLALMRHGCLGRVDSFPDLDQPKLVARVHMGGGSARNVQEQHLFEAISASEARAMWPQSLPVSDTTLTLLGQAVASERAWLEFVQSEPSRQRLMALIGGPSRLQVDEIHFENTALMRSRDGWESHNLPHPMSPGRFSRWRRPFLTIKLRAVANVPQKSVETDQAVSDGVFAVVKTKTDDKHGWLAAGQSLARLFLRARALGVACSYDVGALERPDLRSELRTAIGHKGFAQAILHCPVSRPMARNLPVATYPATATANSI